MVAAPTTPLIPQALQVLYRPECLLSVVVVVVVERERKCPVKYPCIARPCRGVRRVGRGNPIAIMSIS
jgi:hypothetical protein